MDITAMTAIAKCRRSHTVTKNDPVAGLGDEATFEWSSGILDWAMGDAEGGEVRIMRLRDDEHGEFRVQNGERCDNFPPAWHVRSTKYSVQNTPSTFCKGG